MVDFTALIMAFSNKVFDLIKKYHHKFPHAFVQDLYVRNGAVCTSFTEPRKVPFQCASPSDTYLSNTNTARKNQGLSFAEIIALILLVEKQIKQVSNQCRKQFRLGFWAND